MRYAWNRQHKKEVKWSRRATKSQSSWSIHHFSKYRHVLIFPKNLHWRTFQSQSEIVDHQAHDWRRRKILSCSDWRLSKLRRDRQASASKTLPNATKQANHRRQLTAETPLQHILTTEKEAMQSNSPKLENITPKMAFQSLNNCTCHDSWSQRSDYSCLHESVKTRRIDFDRKRIFTILEEWGLTFWPHFFSPL